MEERYLTTEQVASILQVHPFTILKFIRSGKLRGIKLGRVYRIKESDVREFLEGVEVRPKKSAKTSEKKENEVAPTVASIVPPNVVSDEDGHYYVI